jgi:carbohydrate-binding DOMON domain-containing protein
LCRDLVSENERRVVVSNAPNHGSTVPFDGRKTVTTAGTAVPLTTAVTQTLEVDVTALAANTGVVVVGASTVVASVSTQRGTYLNPGDTKTFHNVDLSAVYVDSAVNGEGVAYSGEKAA